MLCLNEHIWKKFGEMYLTSYGIKETFFHFKRLWSLIVVYYGMNSLPIITFLHIIRRSRGWGNLRSKISDTVILLPSSFFGSSSSSSSSFSSFLKVDPPLVVSKIFGCKCPDTVCKCDVAFGGFGWLLWRGLGDGNFRWRVDSKIFSQLWLSHDQRLSICLIFKVLDLKVNDFLCSRDFRKMEINFSVFCYCFCDLLCHATDGTLSAEHAAHCVDEFNSVHFFVKETISFNYVG